jgi:hypothetical protein
LLKALLPLKKAMLSFVLVAVKSRLYCCHSRVVVAEGFVKLERGPPPILTVTVLGKKKLPCAEPT